MRFDRGAHHYVIPVLSDGTVRKETVHLSQWPFWASLVDADFDGDSSVTFNIWGAADKAGEVVIDVSGHRRRIVLEPTLGRTTVERLERGQ